MQKACKSFFCDHRFRVEYRNFVKNFIIVNPHHLLPLSVQIVLWIILIVCDVSVSLVSLFGVFLHFFDRSLSLENDFWSFTFCRLFPRWDRVSCLKNHELLFCWHSNYTWGLSYIIGLFSETAFILSFAGCWFALHSWTSILVLSLALPIVIASPLAKVLPFSRNRSFGCSTDSP